MTKVLDFWKEESYYDLSKKASEELNHPGMKLLFNYGKEAESILDLGCGEGTRLNWVVNGRNIRAVGIDISKKGVEKALSQYPKINFVCGSFEELPDEQFDLVYSAFVLEHLEDPEAYIASAIKHTKKRGIIVFMAPNFGAPSRRSPNSVEARWEKLIAGLRADFANSPKGLPWTRVIPQDNSYNEIDADTQVEPYVLSLMRNLKSKGLKILQYKSLWELEPWSLTPRKLLFKLLGLLGLFPIKYWGPQLLVVVRK